MLQEPRISSRPSRRLGRVFAAGLALAALTIVQTASAQAAPRVVAVADVHGDLPALRAVLRDAGVLDTNDAWVGGDTVLVQLGDLLDRGPAMKSALDFVIGLEAKAGAGGGRFVSMLGNHEAMNLVGDLRYVVPENYAEFADAGSQKRHDDAWRDLVKWQKARAARLGGRPPASGDAEKAAWLATRPAGYLEHRAAFAPDGAYGRWLRGRRAVLVEQGTLFVHGSLSAAQVGRTAGEIDRQVHDEIARFDGFRREFVAEGLALPFFDLVELTAVVRTEVEAIDAAESAARAAAEAKGKSHTTSAKVSARRTRFEQFLDWKNWSIFSGDGPLWCRDFAKWTDDEAATELPKLLAAFGVERFVVGHTPGPKGSIRVRADGAAYLADTGLNTSYVKGGRGSALEIAGGTVTAIYPGPTRELLRQGPAAPPAAEPVPPASPAPAPEPGSAPPPAAPAAPIEAAASTAPTAPSASKPPFLGPDGQPLPFATDDELLAFLRAAPVVEVKDIGEGITRPRRLTFEKDGVRARAIFRNVSEEKRVASVGAGRRELNFRDDYGFEPAAYRLARLLGFDRVPPADLFRLKSESGSIQLWVEKTTTWGKYKEAGTVPPDTLRWKRQLQTMLVWDALVGNSDRNQGNILFGPNWEIWFIDHTRSFRQSTDLTEADKIIWCPRHLYEALRSVTDDQIRESVRGILSPGEVRGVLERRKRLVAHLDGLIRTKGESAVLFDASL